MTSQFLATHFELAAVITHFQENKQNLHKLNKWEQEHG